MAKVIIAGCGGGYDIFGGLPLYYQLDKQAVLTNWSMTDPELLGQYGILISPSFYRVEYHNVEQEPTDYFPEWHLSKQLRQPIYCIADPPSIMDIIKGYHVLLATYNEIETIYMVDGGCDSLLTGCETGLGTPVEDMMHMKCVAKLPIANKYLLAIGVNIDVGDGVVQEELNQRLQVLEDRQILIHKEVWSMAQPAVQYYSTVLKACHPSNTTVQSLILASLEGFEGLYTPPDLQSRIGDSTVNLSSQTRTLYQFKFQELISEIQYFHLLDLHLDSDQIDEIIGIYHDKCRF